LRAINYSTVVCFVFAWLTPVAMAQTPPSAEPRHSQPSSELVQAEKNWRLAVQRTPTDANAFATLGFVLSKEEKYQEAISAYKKAVALNPRLPGVHLNWGLAEFKLGRFAAAVGPLSAALAADPNNLQARTLLGLSYYGAKRFDQAVKQLAVAAKSDAANTQLHQVLAQSCLWAKEYSCALDEFRKIQEQDPDSVASHVLTAEALDGLGRTADAIAEFQAAAKVAPREANVHFGIGYLYWKQHKYAEAKSALEEELAIEPANPQALAYLGDIAMKESDPEKALPLLKKAAQLKNDLRIAYVDMGILLADGKEFPEALAALQHAAKLDPSQPDAHYRMGRIYKQMGNSAAAEKEFAKVRELHEKGEGDIVHQISDSPPPLKP
jgi:tetratricopeptide (TPR) repeat protein